MIMGALCTVCDVSFYFLHFQSYFKTRETDKNKSGISMLATSTT